MIEKIPFVMRRPKRESLFSYFSVLKSNLSRFILTQGQSFRKNFFRQLPQEVSWSIDC